MEDFKIEDDVTRMREGGFSWKYYFKQKDIGKTREGDDQNMFLIREEKTNFWKCSENGATNQRPCSYVGKGPATDRLLLML